MHTKTKPKLIAAAFLTAALVGLVNVVGALVAYGLLFPDSDNQGSLISSSGTGTHVLPQPPAPAATGTGQQAPKPAGGGPAVETKQVYRQPSERLVAGQQPKPAVIVTQPNGKQSYKWCSGTNPDLPDEVCQAIISIVASPTTTNPHLGQKARDALSLLPQNSSLTLLEETWEQSSSTAGTMEVIAHTAEYGDVRLKVVLEKQQNIWVVADGWAL